jgi:hypothetical protein
MGIYTEPPSERNIGQLADDIRIVTEVELRSEGYPAAMAMSEAGFTMARKNSLPPKYEDLDQPPKYDEQMFLATSETNGIQPPVTATANSVPSSSTSSPNPPNTDDEVENSIPARN